MDFISSPGQFEPNFSCLNSSISYRLSLCVRLSYAYFYNGGYRKSHENGILFKGGEHIEGTHAINTVVLDKTGTITNGTPEVTDFSGDDQTLQLLASAEKGSEHPLVEAIVSYAKEKSLEFLEVDHFEAIPGRGINATIDGKELFVGNRKLMSEKGIQTNEVKQISPI